MDGTFDITPPPFKQAYIINAHKFNQGKWYIVDDIIDDYICTLIEGLRVAFCLLPDKRGRTYTELFERLKDEASSRGKQFNPKCIITDYEPGLMPIVEQEVSEYIYSVHIDLVKHIIGYDLVSGSYPIWVYVPF